MKAAVVVKNEVVEYQEIEEPKTEAGTIKVKVMASGICGSVRCGAGSVYEVRGLPEGELLSV